MQKANKSNNIRYLYKWITLIFYSNYLFPGSAIYSIERDTIKIHSITDRIRVENILEDLHWSQKYEFKQIYGFMGFVRIYNVCFICLITGQKEVGEMIPGQPIHMIQRVKLYQVQVSNL